MLRAFVLAALLALLAPISPAAAQGCGQGNPGCTAPTAPPGTNNNQIATTAFVQNAIGGGGIINNDTYFGSGRPSCDPKAHGALQDGVTDDSAAVGICNNLLANLGGGIMHISASVTPMCIKGNVNLAGGVSVVGDGNGYGNNVSPQPAVTISNCGGTNTIFTLNNLGSGLKGLVLLGTQFGAVNPTVFVSGARAWLENNSIQYGAPPLYLNGGGDSIYIGNRITLGYGNATANALLQNAGGQFIRNIFNQSWQGNIPTGQVSITAWSSQAVTAKQSIFSVTGPDGNGYLVQATTNGTSTVNPGGANTPTYTANFTGVDGVTWRLVRPQPASGVYYDLQCDVGCGNLNEYADDHSGAATGFGMTTTGNVPSQVTGVNNFYGDNLGNAISLTAGSTFSSDMAGIAACHLTGCIGVNVTGAWLSDALISNATIANVPIGVNFGVGINSKLATSRVYGATTAGVSIGSGPLGVSIIGNDLGGNGVISGNAVGVLIAAGASDYLTIVDNNFQNATTSISGPTNSTGTHNLIVTGNSNTDIRYQTGTTLFNLNPAALNSNVIAAAAPGVKLVSQDSINMGYGVQAFGLGVGTNNFIRWEGTQASPSAVLLGDELGREGFGGATSSTNAIGGKARFSGFAAENWDGTHNGVYLSWFTTAIGGTTVSEKMRLQADGGLSVGSGNVTNDGGNGVVVATAFAGSTLNQSFQSYRASGVNFNATNGTDIATFNIALPQGATGWVIQRLQIFNCSASMTTSHFGLFDGAGATGNTIIANTAGTNTAQGPVTAASFQAIAGSTATAWYSSATVFLNLITQQGSAVTCNVVLNIVTM